MQSIQDREEDKMQSNPRQCKRLVYLSNMNINLLLANDINLVP